MVAGDVNDAGRREAVMRRDRWWSSVAASLSIERERKGERKERGGWGGRGVKKSKKNEGRRIWQMMLNCRD